MIWLKAMLYRWLERETEWYEHQVGLMDKEYREREKT